ncbi:MULTISPECIES: hypothetical protein [Synergistales]|uniref:hypothetical protein n=1 Tax=Synergistales TaxID=649776 RepID=UPI00236891E8|nr:hypothetical protein [Aminithiophilus ramosus]
MLEMVMASDRFHPAPAVSFENLDYLAGFHGLPPDVHIMTRIIMRVMLVVGSRIPG